MDIGEEIRVIEVDEKGLELPVPEEIPAEPVAEPDPSEFHPRAI